MNDELGEKQFFITPPHDCSYLPHQQARTLFLDPRETVTGRLYLQLTELGFRRSGSHLYRPHCESCRACVPTRLPVAEFAPKRRQRRVLQRNHDLTIRQFPASFRADHYELYARYIAARHSDGDMFPASEDQYRSFLLSQWSNTTFLCAYLDERLVSVAVCDQQASSLSAIYTFFEPALSERSLGVYSILQQIALCQKLHLTHLYLGYWIRNSPKMCYKTDYRPVELFIGGRWLRLT